MKTILWVVPLLLLHTAPATLAQEGTNDLPDSHLGNLYRLSNAKSRSISPENPTGEKGKGGTATEGTGAKAARDLGKGWKISPSVDIAAGAVYTVAEINGPGTIEHIWITPTGNWRFSILRMYWDDETSPSVEVPLGDFFALGWGKYARISSLAVCVNPGSAFNSYWPMPFRHKAKITLENLDSNAMTLFYQVDYVLSPVPNDAAFFHAQFRRVNPLPYEAIFTIVDSNQGERPVRRNLSGLGRAQQRLVGGGGNKVLYGWRPRVPDHQWDWNRGLLQWVVRFREPTDASIRGIHKPLLRISPGPQAGWALPVTAAVRTLSVAHTGPGPIHLGFAGNDPSAGLEEWG
jgi:hypothetical protein